MNHAVKHGMRLVCEALERDGIEHFVSDERLTIYYPCKAELKRRKLRPNLIRVYMTPQDGGLLFEANLPIALCASNEKTRRQILRLVAKENSGMSYGGLVYEHETQKMVYRAFRLIQRNAYKIDPDMVLTNIRIAVDILSEGYQNVINALDGMSDGGGCEEMIFQTDDKTEMDIECLLDLQNERNLVFLLDEPDECSGDS